MHFGKRNEIFIDFFIFRDQIDEIDPGFFYFKDIDQKISPDAIEPDRTKVFEW